MGDSATAPSAGFGWLLGGCLAYLALVAWVFGPLPGNIDSFAFKDAAASLALGQGFTTAHNFGNATGAALIYSGHPPGYGCGLLLGCSPDGLLIRC